MFNTGRVFLRKAGVPQLRSILLSGVNRETFQGGMGTPRSELACK